MRVIKTLLISMSYAVLMFLGMAAYAQNMEPDFTARWHRQLATSEANKCIVQVNGKNTDGGVVRLAAPKSAGIGAHIAKLRLGNFGNFCLPMHLEDITVGTTLRYKENTLRVVKIDNDIIYLREPREPK